MQIFHNKIEIQNKLQKDFDIEQKFFVNIMKRQRKMVQMT